MEDKLLKENKYLKERIAFLEMIIEVNKETITKVIDTNVKLLDWLEERFKNQK